MSYYPSCTFPYRNAKHITIPKYSRRYGGDRGVYIDNLVIVPVEVETKSLCWVAFAKSCLSVLCKYKNPSTGRQKNYLFSARDMSPLSGADSSPWPTSPRPSVKSPSALPSNLVKIFPIRRYLSQLVSTVRFASVGILNDRGSFI